MDRKKNAGAKKATGMDNDLTGKPAAQPDQPVIDKQGYAFPVVAIGSSAGGLDSLEKFFINMPVKSNMAFVVIVHLDPSHSTILPELLQKCTQMPVALATDQMRVEPNSVYILPPNKTMTIAQRTLYLFPKTEPFSSRLPIDGFMRSLAEDQGQNAIGIIMSGAGADGSIGMRSIKSEGGLTMAQDLVTAKYEGMPSSAIATGIIDHILPPEKMPAKILTYIKDSIYFGPEKPLMSGNEAVALRKIFALLRNVTGHDFSLYKQKTIGRRIFRRMVVCNINDIASYANYMEVNRTEVKSLFRELLIGVTNFFRDPEAFEALKQKVILPMMNDKRKDYIFRVWIPGCATGEEAYSLAILFKECMEELNKEFSFQFFGTDIDEEAIEIARSGVYPLSIASDVGTERLRTFFSQQGNGYRIRKDLREIMIFALQDIAKDPPFIKIDLLSCRNLLMYMEPELQKRIIPIFHYSIMPGGALMLGYSETIGGHHELFEMNDKKWKIYSRLGQHSHFVGQELFPAYVLAPEDRHPKFQPEYETVEKNSPIQHIRKALLDNFAPPSAVIDENNNILYIHGRTGHFLEPADGATQMNIVEMAKPSIKSDLVTAIRLARLQQREIVKNSIEIRDNSRLLYINLHIKPISEPEPVKGLILVIFEPSPGLEIDSLKTKKKEAAVGSPQRLKELEKELELTKGDLQVTIEELQGANEELRSANEELQSSNEELQSSNEEMETSKEELQSLNEELVTVNAELQSKIEELAQINDDLDNLMNATSIATIFLDTNLKVRRFTPEAREIVSLIISDIGRPISDLASNLVNVNLSSYAARVLETLIFIEEEVVDKNGRYYQLRIVPYRTLNNIISGVVVSFSNITKMKRIEQTAREATLLADNVVETVRDPLLVLDSDLKVISANHAFYEKFKTNSQNLKGRPFYMISDSFGDGSELGELLEKILPQKSFLEDYPLKLKLPNQGERELLLNAREIKQEVSQARKILLAFRDVTDMGSAK